MPKIAYEEKNFRESTLRTIDAANRIISEYSRAGYVLTLRQLYYQFVARDLIPNSQREYKKLGSIISDGRLAGLIDWHAIEDRTRNLQSNGHWKSPGLILQAAAESYAVDKWEHAPTRLEVWVEKEALAGVVERPAERWDVPWFCCRGYVSQSEQWAAGRRLAGHIAKGQDVVILHLGDHDPSGIDMTRDIAERVSQFAGNEYLALQIKRIALNMNQVEEENPPPNPAKATDSRFASYMERFGGESWELDALRPEYLDQLIERHIVEHLDKAVWDEAVAREEEGRERLLSFIDEVE